MVQNFVLVVILISIIAWTFLLYNSIGSMTASCAYKHEGFIQLVDFTPPLKYSDFDVYLINLDRNKDRLDAFIDQYTNCDLRRKQVKRFAAIDGQKVENLEEKVTSKAYAEITEVEKTGYRTKHYQLTRGGVGCYLSHMAVYELIRDGESHFGLIFEDDVIIDKYIFKRLNDVIINVPNDWDMLLLSCHCIVCEKMDMYYDTGKFFWLHCYLVRKTSVEKIMKYLKSNKIGKQIDSELSDMIGLGILKVYCLKESLCKQGSVFQTTIQTPLKVVPGINPWAMA